MVVVGDHLLERRTEPLALLPHVGQEFLIGDNVMRVLPPLTIEEGDIREFVETLSAAAAEYEVPAAAA